MEMKHIIVVFALLASFAACSSIITPVENVTNDVLTRLEGVYEFTWGLNITRKPYSYLEQYVHVVQLIEGLRSPRVPNQFLSYNLKYLTSAIESRYTNFVQLIMRSKKERISKSDWQILSKQITGNGFNNVKDSFISLSELLYQKDDTGLFWTLNRPSGFYPPSYTTKQSTCSSLYYLLILTRTLQLKAYTMLQFCYNNLIFDKEKADLMRKELFFSMRKQNFAIPKTFDAADWKLWNDGPKKFTLGVTYETMSKTEKISLLPIFSDYKRNRVIVGVRFIKVGNVLYLQPKQAILLPNGEINNRSIEWVGLPASQNTKTNFYDLSAKEVRINMKECAVPNNQIVTGLQFRANKDEISLYLHGTNFLFMRGLTNKHPSGSQWHFSKIDKRFQYEFQNNPKSLLQYNDKSIGTVYNVILSKSSPISPYFDLQEVSSDPYTPVQSIGMLTKGYTSGAGVLAPYIASLNFRSYMKYPSVPIKKINLLNSNF